MSGIILMCSDSYGIYCPQKVVEEIEGIWDLDPEDAIVIAQGPEHEWYWEAWTSVLDDATYTDSKGFTWRLHQDGDVWAYCPELMSDEDYLNFFGEPRENPES